ncbi:hypothetical protein KC678_04505, partial [Candidatus Dojkabacteria bacterium]|nr:hypothetical protein [Candidatus Dojkabacteria bacterium]
MKNQHYILRSSLIAFALFFSAYTIAFGNIYLKFRESEKTSVLGATTSTDESTDLVITSEISNIIEEDGLIQVTYKFSAKNTKEKPITDLKLQADFSGTFPSNEFEILDIESIRNFNSEFNGLTDKNLFADIPVLEPGNVATANVTLSFDPQGFEGPFENNIFASGFYDGEEIKQESQNQTNGQSQNNTNNSNQPNTTTTNPSNTNSNGNNDKPKDKPQETDFSQRDIHIVLIDTTTNEEITEVSDGQVINFEDGDNPFTLQVNVTPGTEGSVLFGLNGNKKYRVENLLPYAIVNNSPNNYDAWYPEPGIYTLTVTVYSEDLAKGEILGEKEITFTLGGDIPAPVVEEVIKEDEKESALAVTESSAKSSFTITLTPNEEQTNTEQVINTETTTDSSETESSSSSGSGISGVSIFDHSINTANIGEVSGLSTSNQVQAVSIDNPFTNETSGSVY